MKIDDSMLLMDTFWTVRPFTCGVGELDCDVSKVTQYAQNDIGSSPRGGGGGGETTAAGALFPERCAGGSGRPYGLQKPLDRFKITLYAYKNMTSPFATKIKEKRRELGLSLRKVCESVLNEDNKPISVSYLNDIEQCYRKPPSGKIIIQIAKALELDPEELLNLAGKVDPTVEDAVSKNSEVGVLFRKIVQVAKNDPGVMDRINKEIDKKDDAVDQ